MRHPARHAHAVSELPDEHAKAGSRAARDAKAGGGGEAPPSQPPDDLEHVAMLRGVAAPIRRELSATASKRALNAGDVVIRQGAPGDHAYFVLAGELAVTLGDPSSEPIAVIKAGETVAR